MKGPNPAKYETIMKNTKLTDYIQKETPTLPQGKEAE
jgi:hypothetical protein